jgi:hypothetical protein
MPCGNGMFPLNVRAGCHWQDSQRTSALSDLVIKAKSILWITALAEDFCTVIGKLLLGIVPQRIHQGHPVFPS